MSWPNAAECARWEINTFQTISVFPWRRYRATAIGYAEDGKCHARFGFCYYYYYGHTRASAEIKVRRAIVASINEYKAYQKKQRRQTAIFQPSEL